MAHVELPEPLGSLFRVEEKAVTNVFGPPGAGKTNVCMLAMLDCINRLGGSVTYIDTEGGFSFDRLAQLMPNYKLVLSKVNLLEPKDFREQGRMIRGIEGTELVIVDSLSALYRLEYAEADHRKRGEVNAQIMESNRELSKQLSVLSALSRERGMPVLVTSHIFKAWDTGNEDVVGGDSVKYWSKGLVLLEKTGRSGERKATVVKHRSVPEGECAKFAIDSQGIKPIGFKLL